MLQLVSQFKMQMLFGCGTTNTTDTKKAHTQLVGSSIYITFQKWPKQIMTYNGEMKSSMCWWTAAECALSQQSTNSMYEQYSSTYTIGGLFSLQNCWMKVPHNGYYSGLAPVVVAAASITAASITTC